jgi:hypothetical protein
MRIDIWVSEREQATVDETGLKVLKKELVDPQGETRYVLNMWKPKAQKPYVHGYFRSWQMREDKIRDDIRNFRDYQQYKVEQRAENAPTDDDIAKVQVGTIFCWSWGYDQTNVDFFEVTEKRGRKVIVRAIAQESVSGSEGFMSDSVIPLPHNFLEDNDPQLPRTLTKIVKFNNREPNLSMEYGWAGLWSGKPHYRSWYAY